MSDRGQLQDRYRTELITAGIEYEEGQHTEEKILAADEVIKSPGIPDTVPLVRKLVSKGIPVISEIEFAARFTTATLIGITGSNGKTTTATLTHHLLATAGLDVCLAGNVGTSFARALAEGRQPDFFVLELSSFQLDGIQAFRPHLAALLNITPDHLDRYDYQLDNYIDSKFRIGMNQHADDHFWFFAEDENTQQGRQRNPLPAQLHPVSLNAIRGEMIQVGDQQLDLGPTALQGKHNALNALFAAEMAIHLGVEVERLQAGLNAFVPVPHRLEPVGEVKGVRYINDSKATNVDAVTYALDAMQRPIIWIAGGTDKGNDYEPLLVLAARKVKALVCLGVDNSKLKAAFAEQIETIKEAQSMEAALKAAHELATKGDVVLLSPACASFDLFKNYVDRGDQFRQGVQDMIDKP